MHRLFATIPLILLAQPAVAQLTPAQRAAVENRPSAAKARQLSDGWERRALNGDPTAYFGQATRQDRRESRDRMWRQRSRYTLPALIYSPNEIVGSERATGRHWIAIGIRNGTPDALRRPEGQVLAARANIPLRLTLASPIGAPRKSLMIRTAVGPDITTPVWSRMGDIAADEQGNYRVDVPTLAAGDYELLVQVFDPDHPEAPYSTSQTLLLIRTP